MNLLSGYYHRKNGETIHKTSQHDTEIIPVPNYITILKEIADTPLSEEEIIKRTHLPSDVVGRFLRNQILKYKMANKTGKDIYAITGAGKVWIGAPLT